MSVNKQIVNQEIPDFGLGNFLSIFFLKYHSDGGNLIILGWAVQRSRFRVDEP